MFSSLKSSGTLLGTLPLNDSKQKLAVFSPDTNIALKV